MVNGAGEDSGRLTRRRWFGGAGALAAAMLLPPYADAAELPSLADTAAARGLIYGATPETTLADTPEFARLFISQCRLLAPILSWTAVMPVRDRPDPSWEDPNVGFARAHDLPLTGFHLLWYQGTPPWVDSLDRAAMEKAVLDHIAAMGARYRGRLFSWNVVNEAIDPDNGGPDGLRRFPLLDRLGPELFTIAFGAARAADPKAIRVYNDYGMELATPGEERRRSALLRLLDRLQRADVSIDAVGLQSHLRWQGFSFDPARYRAFLREIAARGLSIIISELDVLDVGTPAEPAQRDKAVAEIYARFLAAALDEPAVIALVGWGLSDRYTWLTPHSAPIFARSDGLPGRPLPFDDHFQPKPAYWAMLNALKHAPPRKV